MPRGRTTRPVASLGALTALAAAVLLTGGCARTQEAAALPPVGSPTASSTAALPPLGPPDFPVPAQARQKTPEGVSAFTHYYVELLNHQLASLDSAPIRDLSSYCDVCDQLADSYDRIQAADQHFEGGLITVVGTGTAVVTGDRAEISFLLRQEPATLRDASGAALPGWPGPELSLSGGLVLTWEAQRTAWTVSQFDADRT